MTNFQKQIVALVVFVAAGLAVAWQIRQDNAAAVAHKATDAANEKDRDKREKIAAAIALISKVQEQSKEIMPEVAAGVGIGMTRGDLMIVRPSAVPGADNRDGYSWMREVLPNGSQVLYGFEPMAQRLLQVQVLSVLRRGQDLATHLSHMNEKYGVPTGAWNCKDDEGIPTRRFTWRRELATLSDIFLTYGDRISVTQHIAPSEITIQSLQKSHCEVVSGEEIAVFPEVPADKVHSLSSRQDEAPEAEPGTVVQHYNVPIGPQPAR